MKNTTLLLWLALVSSANLFAGGTPCASLAIDSVQITDVSCNGGSDGEITVFASGGTGPYTYSNGQGSGGATINVLQDFSTNVIYNSGNVTGSYYSPSTCSPGNYFTYGSVGGCTGGMAIYSGTGSGGYSGCYLRTPQADASGFSTVTMSFDITHSYNSGRPNDKITFSIWINNGYRNTTVVPVTVNGTLSNELTFDQARTCERVTVEFDISSATLIDKSDMLLYINSSCGYSTCNSYYVYIDNIEVLEGGAGSAFQASSTFTGLSAGSYDVTIEDANNCQATYTFNPVVVNEPAAISVTVDGYSPSTTTGTDGKVWAAASGGDAPYTYQWNSLHTGDTIFNASTGNYCVTVTDANGCTSSNCKSIPFNPCPLSVYRVTATHVSCYGGNDGSFTITAADAIGAVEYSIDDGLTWGPDSYIDSLPYGVYRISVRDSRGCVADWFSVVLLTQRPRYNASISSTPPTTFGGSDGELDLTISGATPPYTYWWSTTDTTQDVTGLSVGTYMVTVTDTNGCDTVLTATVNNPGCTMSLTETHVDVSCNGQADGSITVTAANGTGPYTYSIDGGNTYQASATFSGLSGGSYTITAEDVNQCTAGVVVNIVEAGTLNATTSVTSLSAPGAGDGAVDVTAIDGTPPYSFLWNIGDTTEDINLLVAGNYCVTITDNNGCTYSTCETVNYINPACIGFDVTNVAIQQPTCPGDEGSVTISISGGQNPVLYSVDYGATFQNGVSLFDLSPGTYNVLVRDNAGCEAVASNNPIVINTPASIDPVIFNANGSFAIVDTFVSYLWFRDGSPISGETDTLLGSPSVGVYTVEVTDSRGCKDTSNALYIAVGIEEELLNKTKLYPNPVTDKLYVEGGGSEAISITITDLQGRAIISKELSNAKGSIDMSTVAKGMYLVQLQSGNATQVRKLLVD